MPGTTFHDIFQTGADTTAYRQLGDFGLEEDTWDGDSILKVPAEALRALSEEAFSEINHFLRTSHLRQLRSILEDDEASHNDRFVAFELLKNANIAAAGVLPMCQDTGTAIIMAKKGRRVWTKGGDGEHLGQGIFDAYQKKNLRYSQVSPVDMFLETNTRNNLPAQIEIFQEGEEAYKFLFIAKGGGSANKSFLYQGTPALLERTRMLSFLKEKILTLGTAACPPYHLAVVIGGLSAEQTLKTVKLASTHFLDTLPTSGGDQGYAFRDLELEATLHEMTRSVGIGAQFGGKYFCHDVRVIRLPRHGASLPIGLGVSCSADRQALGKITREGVFLEQLEHDPAQFLPDMDEQALSGAGVAIDLNRPMAEILEQLSACPVKTRVDLTGPMIVARDSAHRRIREQIAQGGAMPSYLKDHPVYYAGPAKKPDGYASGSFGPTTAGRMDGFVDEFQALGGSMVMLAKGNRSAQVRRACQRHGGFYLGSIGGPAARLAQDCIKDIQCLDFEDLGMEAVWRIEVEKFPAFVIVDDKGHDFFVEITAQDLDTET